MDAHIRSEFLRGLLIVRIDPRKVIPLVERVFDFVYRRHGAIDVRVSCERDQRHVFAAARRRPCGRYASIYSAPFIGSMVVAIR
jgi:hypothetical protein